MGFSKSVAQQEDFLALTIVGKGGKAMVDRFNRYRISGYCRKQSQGSLIGMIDK